MYDYEVAAQKVLSILGISIDILVFRQNLNTVGYPDNENWGIKTDGAIENPSGPQKFIVDATWAIIYSTVQSVHWKRSELREVHVWEDCDMDDLFKALRDWAPLDKRGMKLSEAKQKIEELSKHGELWFLYI